MPEKNTITTETNSILDEILSGLNKQQKTLPSKLFYDERGSKLFDKICELNEYYPTRTEMRIMEENIDDIASVFDDESIFIEFGSGSSLKTRLLLDHLQSIAGYVPIDISKEHLLKSADELRREFPELDIYPVPADYTKPLKLPTITRNVSHKIAYFPGSTIGNFPIAEAKQFLSVIHELVGDEGGLIIGADLKKDLKILELAYNDTQGVTAEFNLNILRRLNNEFNFDIPIEEFEHRAIYNEEFGRIEMHLFAKSDVEFGKNGQKFNMKKGESILTEYSHKYSLDDFAKLVADHFTVDKVWTDENRMFSVQFLTTK